MSGYYGKTLLNLNNNLDQWYISDEQEAAEVQLDL